MFHRHAELYHAELYKGTDKIRKEQDPLEMQLPRIRRVLQPVVLTTLIPMSPGQLKRPGSRTHLCSYFFFMALALGLTFAIVFLTAVIVFLTAVGGAAFPSAFFAAAFPFAFIGAGLAALPLAFTVTFLPPM